MRLLAVDKLEYSIHGRKLQYLFNKIFLFNCISIYRPECQAQVQGFSGPIFKKFNTMNEAEDFVNQRGNSNETHTRFNSISLGSTSSSTSIASKRSYSDDKSSAAPKSKKSKIDEKKTAEFTKDIVKMARYGKYDFMQDIDGYVQVYTDGACENNGKPTAVAGKGVWFGDGHAL